MNTDTDTAMTMHTDTEASPTAQARRNAVHTALIRRARASSEPEAAWLYLEAAHVVGQQRLWPHTLTHAHMLRLALRTGDAGETLGQVMRLALVPLGHLSGRLPLGHVAVVSRVVERRVLMLTHANWSRFNGERGHAERDVTLYDVSPDNDWSEVKVWFRDSEGLGSIYPVKGFIYGGRPSPQITTRNPDYVGALIDAYAAR